jgi:H+-transporting ATPase
MKGKVKTNLTSSERSEEALPALMERLQAREDGLTRKEAEKRLERYGSNEITEKRIHPVLKFLSYFWGPIPWMIEIAATLSALVGHWSELGIILVLLFVNAAVGFWEEFQAGNTIAALKAKLALRARALRDGKWTILPARELVPGDVIRLRIGDIVPADVKILEGDPVQVDQSALTGESLPVTLESGRDIYSGSTIQRGEVDALVYGTGENTYFGRTAKLVRETHSMSHFQRVILRIGDYLILVALTLVILILGVSLFRGDDMLTTLQFTLILTVAAIPVAMPTVLSVTMAIGARILARKKAIVTHLSSMEEMAGIDVLCTDKTGTLTQNRLTLGEPFTVDGVPPEDVIRSAALASREEDRDPIDQAVLSGMKKTGWNGYRVVHFLPFDPVQKRTEAAVETESGERFKVTKGAPQVILDLASNREQIRQEVEKAIHDFAVLGFRSLGVARTNGDSSWRFLGVLPLFDPPRKDSKSTLLTAKEMGIGVKMLTGDQLAIAKETARQLELGDRILDAASLPETKQHEAARMDDTIEQADGFAQVFPEHKYYIVDVLQKRGHLVGMTGDGVNDAPALKKADAGIAVSGATDAARSAADIVLLSPGLSVFIDAVKEARRIFRRMNSYAVYRIAETIRVLLFMTLSILAFNFYPVTAVMIVLLALLNDGAILTIAYDRARYSHKPNTWNLPTVLGIATLLGLTGVVASFGLFYLGEQVFHLGRDLIQSLMYLKLSVAGHLTIFLTRTHKSFLSERPATVLLVAVLGTQVIATFIAVYGLFMTPLGWSWALFVWGYALVWFLINDRVKLAAYRIFGKHHDGLMSKKRG